MKPSIRQMAGVAALAVLLGACSATHEPATAPVAAVQPPSNQAMKALSAEVFTYAYPLVLMDVTRELMSLRTPPNTFSHKRTFPDASFTEVVTPNADTLYSSAWLDLSKEPVVLSVPDTRGRYYLMPLMDAWTNVFASPGKRTTGTQRGNFVITGPGWEGPLPKGMKQIKSPTAMVWLIGRTQANGKKDFPAVHRLQDQYRLTPLSAWQMGVRAAPEKPAPRSPTLDTQSPPVEQVAAMDAQAFFSRFASLLPANPPAAADAAMVEKMRRMGLEPGVPFKTTVLEPSTARAVQEGATAALQAISEMSRKGSADAGNGWVMHRDLGNYGVNYGRRAVTAMVGLGANLPEDAIYASTRTDAAGKALQGSTSYVLHFAKDQLPPARAFWSLSLYNQRQAFVENPIGRYAIGSRDHLRYNRDGSLDIYIQHERPERGRVANWLPAPPDALNMTLRAYWPEQALLDGTWMPPPVERAN
ncbi:hypothetical protein LMG31506_03505 [Cupriavidus yeoncheonensis]|uniref:DUF1254 domain-containing protein n=1 Tax=Cupriavidus yeoncheonensis TaxID=1462994 RepID=A0A916IVK2_9BURK|nr:DUF1254 domain-containing protein [Cupriavidus yeoncheonensis]CAG2146921.1 hypothetical protein LMG31506_03505 [Cupriavidus yeoncheonensis]